MRVINNLEIVKSLLKFKISSKGKPEIYYFVQVIQRRKENPDLPLQEIQRYAWWVTDLGVLEKSWNRLTEMCEHYKARAYISITPRSLEKFGKQCMFEYSKRVANNDYTNIHNLPKKVALSNETVQSKGVVDKPRWILDIDSEDKSYQHDIEKFISGYTNILGKINTPNGCHLVIESFNYGLIKDYLVSKKREDYKIISDNEVERLFTLRREGNTILYAVTN